MNGFFVNVLEEESRRPLGHKRSLSSESPRSLMHTEEAVTYPSYIVAGSREMAIDVYDLKGIFFFGSCDIPAILVIIERLRFQTKTCTREIT